MANEEDTKSSVKSIEKIDFTELATLGTSGNDVCVFNIEPVNADPHTIRNYPNPWNDLQLVQGGRQWKGEPHRHFIIVPIDNGGLYAIMSGTTGNALYPQPEPRVHEGHISVIWKPRFAPYKHDAEDDKYYWYLAKSSSGNATIYSNYSELVRQNYLIFTPDKNRGDDENWGEVNLIPHKEAASSSWPNPCTDFKISQIYRYCPPAIKHLNDRENIGFPPNLRLKDYDQGLPKESEHIPRGETIIPFIYIQDGESSPENQLVKMRSLYYKLSRYQYWLLIYHHSFSGKIGKTIKCVITRKVGVTKEDLESMSKSTSTTIDEEASLSVSGWGASASGKISRQLKEDLNVAASTSTKQFTERDETTEINLTLPNEKCEVAKWRLVDEYCLYRMKPYIFETDKTKNVEDLQAWEELPIRTWIVKRTDRTVEDSYPNTEINVKVINKAIKSEDLPSCDGY